MAIKLTGARGLFFRLAARWRKLTASRLRSGRGVDNRTLARKKFPNGRPLAFARTSQGIPGRVARAPIQARNTGFTITVAQKTGDQLFHEGRSRQVPRPYAAFDDAYLETAADSIVEALGRAGKKGGLFL